MAEFVTSGSPDLDAGIFYVRTVIDGDASLVSCSLCAVCFSIVPTKCVDPHAEWHAATTAPCEG